MNQQLYKNMMAARRDLIDARTDLALIRAQATKDEHRVWITVAERNFLRALDRAWDTQCMAQGSL